MKKECEALKNLQHDNIIKLIDDITYDEQT